MWLACCYRGAWVSPLLCTSRTQTWGWSLFPFPFHLLHSLSALWRERHEASQEPCLRKGNRKAPFPSCL